MEPSRPSTDAAEGEKSTKKAATRREKSGASPGYREEREKRSRLLVCALFAVALLSIGAMVLLFNRPVSSDERSTAVNSACSLIEISRQIKAGVEISLQKDYEFSQSLKTAVSSSLFQRKVRCRLTCKSSRRRRPPLRGVSGGGRAK
mgnify:CR=1 FL=1